jgi:hypothetical protein
VAPPSRPLHKVTRDQLEDIHGKVPRRHDAGQPQIAPESPGDLFDATEIDEILTLRILAMTDEEKRDMAAVDERARALLERTEALTATDMARLHGTLRDPRLGETLNGKGPEIPWRAIDAKPQLAFLRARGADLNVGDRVRLHPKAGADIMDIVLEDEVAVIEAERRRMRLRMPHGCKSKSTFSRHIPEVNGEGAASRTWSSSSPGAPTPDLANHFACFIDDAHVGPFY